MAPPPADLPTARRRLTRRQLLALAGGLASLPVGGVYATQVEPFWPRLHELPVPVRDLPAAFAGFRVAHLSDTHAGRVPIGYLAGVVDRVRAMRPDAVLFTGDLTQHQSDAVKPMADLFARFVADGTPVYASFGNHDYGVDRGPDDPADPSLAPTIDAALTSAGCVVLHNRATPVVRGADRLWVVGLEDYWFGKIDPAAAFAGVPTGQPRIALSHNPDTVPLLDPYAPDLILSGHTHGGQIRLPGYGAIHLNVRNPRHDWGLFPLAGGRHLYVSSGVGFIRRMRFNCRPEVPVLRLERAVPYDRMLRFGRGGLT